MLNQIFTAYDRSVVQKLSWFKARFMAVEWKVVGYSKRVVGHDSCVPGYGRFR